MGVHEEWEGMRCGRAFEGKIRANKSITSNCESQRRTGAQRVSQRIQLSNKIIRKTSQEKYRIRETKHLSIDADSSTNTKQDRNSTYGCAFRGLRIYNLFNIFNFPI